MRRLLTAALFMMALLAREAAFSEVRVYFSPRGGCDQAVLQLVQGAQMYLDAACYTFSLDDIADQLIAAKQRGVVVRVILDRTQANQTWCPARKLVLADIPVKVNSHPGLMHDKFLVADRRDVVTGSFNWTKAAIEKNDENVVLLLDERAAAAAFARQFDTMWNDARRFSAYAPRPVEAPVSSPAVSAPTVQGEVTTEAVYITQSGKKYHRPGCRYLARSSIPISRQEAEERGFAPCKVCNP